MRTDKFTQLYKGLNSAQREAVDWIEGPVMVVAGPGTGKTQILTLRIANILRRTDVESGNILALTFTEAGITAMRRRLAEIIGGRAYSVVINTFHGFCNNIIKTYPEEFPRIIGSVSINEVDQLSILREIIDSMAIKELKPFGDTLYYLRSIISSINDLKREGVDCKKFQKVVKQELKDFNAIEDLYYDEGAHKGKIKGRYQKQLRQIKKNRELAKVYQEYQKQLDKRKLYDYSDMIMEVLRELSQNKNLLLILQEQHQYVLADEHQDTNNAQNRIMELLCSFHKNPNIFVVGDEKQAIFRFQGASLENFNYFKKLYPEAKLVVLDRNYRSSQAILDGAHSLIAGPRPLQAAKKRINKKISILTFSRTDVEQYGVAKEIKKKLAAGVKPQDIAVIYRENKDAFSLARIFEKVGIPFSIESNIDILSDTDIKKLLLFLEAVSEFGSEEKLLKAMHVDFLEINPLDIYKIADYRSRNKIFTHDVLKSKKTLQSLHLESEDKISDFYRNLLRWKTAEKNKGFLEFFETVINESGFLSSILRSKNAVEKLDVLGGLFDEVKTLVEKHKDYDLSDFLRYLNIVKNHNVFIKKGSTTMPAKRVHMMTAHGSKGREFDHVFIANAVDGHWGNKRHYELLQLPARTFSLSGGNLERGSNDDDERRLFYVALTRARKEVFITYAKVGPDRQDQLPSRFIGEIGPELINFASVHGYEKDFDKHKDIFFIPGKPLGADIKSKDFIGELFLERGLSVTALNNYLKCPWRYFYVNLLRIPRAKSRPEMYGTAVHGALKDFFDEIKNGSGGKKLLLDRFGYYLSHEALSGKDLERTLIKGRNSLSGYYDFYKNSWLINTISELNVPAVMLDNIRLNGKIDKVEFVGAGNEVNVVDYKTGRPKTRGEIEGVTKNSDGNYKRQLVFYNLLLDRYEKGKYKMVSSDIDFVEPDGGKHYKKERFIITKEEVMELIELIRKSANEILGLGFWDKTCGEKDCEFCALRAVMK